MSPLNVKFLGLAVLCVAAIVFAACSGRDTEQRPLTDAERAHAVEMWSGLELPDDARILTEDHAKRGWSFSFLTQGNPADVSATCNAQITSMGFQAINSLLKVERPVPGWLSIHRSSQSDMQVHASKTPHGTLIGIQKVNNR